jgi:hypothetical protein
MDNLNEEHICIMHPLACMLCLMSSSLCSRSHMLIIFFSLKLLARITRSLILSMSLRLDLYSYIVYHLKPTFIFPGTYSLKINPCLSQTSHRFPSDFLLSIPLTIYLAHPSSQNLNPNKQNKFILSYMLH